MEPAGHETGILGSEAPRWATSAASDLCDDAIVRAAELAGFAEERARQERRMATWQGTNSRWRIVFEHAAQTHERAAALQAEAVTLLLELRALRERMLREACLRPPRR
jgi:hypothetical protein